MKDRERGGGDGVRVRKWRRGGEGESEVYIKIIHIRFHPILGSSEPARCHRLGGVVCAGAAARIH